MSDIDMHLSKKHEQRSAWLFIVLIFFIGLILLYPGFLQWDSVIQLRQARSGHFTDWHPPIMSYTWRIIDYVVAGPFGMLALQLLVLTVGLKLIFEKAGISTRTTVLVFLVIFCVFFPPVFGILGAIFKDVLLSGILTLAFGIAAVFENKLKIEKQRFSNADVAHSLFIALMMVVLGIYAMGLRHNAFPAVFPLIWFGIYSLLSRRNGAVKSMVFSGIIAVLGTILLVIVAITVSSGITDQKKHAWVSVVTFDLVGITLECDESILHSPDTPKKLGNLLSGPPPDISEIRSSYTPRDWWSSATGASFENLYRYKAEREELAELVRMWRTAVQKCPLSYLKHRWNVFKNVIGLSEHAPNEPVFMTTMNVGAGVNLQRAKQKLHHDYKLSAIQVSLKAWLKKLASNTILFAPYLYLALLIPVIAVGIWRLISGKGGLVFFLSVSGLFYEIGLYFVAPAPEYRYSHWMVLACWIALLLLGKESLETLFARRREKKAIPDDLIPNPESSHSLTSER